MTRYTIATFVLVSAACNATPDPEPDCAGGTCDEQVVASCQIADVFGFEKVMAPAYGFDPLGVNQSDPAMTRASVVRVDGKLRMQLGKRTVGAAAGDKVTELEPSDEVIADTEQLRFRADDKKAKESFELRIFSANQVGILLHKEKGSSQFLSFASVDCNPANALPAAPPKKSPVTASAKELTCTVVQYDPSSTLDSAMGSTYDYSAAGERNTFDDHDDVGVQESDSSEHPDGVIADFGGLTFGLHDAGDTIEFSDERPQGAAAKAKFLRWRLAFVDSEAGDEFEVRVFAATGTGVVIGDDDDDGRVVAQLDCRDAYERPAILDI